MAGASFEHNDITANVLVTLRALLRGKGCKAVGSDQRFTVPATGLFTYPDVTVVCGKPEFHPKDRDTLINPRVLVEVLSDATEAYDRGAKFAHYRSIPSLWSTCSWRRTSDGWSTSSGLRRGSGFSPCTAARARGSCCWRWGARCPWRTCTKGFSSLEAPLSWRPPLRLPSEPRLQRLRETATDERPAGVRPARRRGRAPRPAQRGISRRGPTGHPRRRETSRSIRPFEPATPPPHPVRPACARSISTPISRASRQSTFIPVGAHTDRCSCPDAHRAERPILTLSCMTRRDQGHLEDRAP